MKISLYYILIFNRIDMKNKFMEYHGKRVTVMGLGLYEHGSGIEAAKFFISRGAEVIITDLRPATILRPQVARLNKFIKKYLPKGCPPPVFHFGGHRDENFIGRDIIVKNPGVKSSSPFLALAISHGAEVVTDITIFFERCANQVIGVTGTRGKSTTSSLIAAILKAAGRQVFFGGNNTISPLFFMDKLKKNDMVVLELSSWALEGLAKIKKSPDVAVVTNIYPDHLNTYDGLADYISAKKNIFKFQQSGDFVVLNKNDDTVRKMSDEARGQVVWFDRFILSGSRLLGEHNEANMAAAVSVAKLFKVPQSIINRTIKVFKGLPGRLESVRVKRGIQWYNDTTATSPDGTRVALKTLAGKNKNIILIAGGVDKYLPYDGFGREIEAQTKLVILLPGTATEKMKSEMHHFVEASGMPAAVASARLAAAAGDIVLLSPGAASLNIFKNEYDRGEQFVKLVSAKGGSASG